MWRYSLQKNQIEVRKSKVEKHIREWEEARCKKWKIDKKRERKNGRKKKIVVSTKLHIDERQREEESRWVVSLILADGKMAEGNSNRVI